MQEKKSIRIDFFFFLMKNNLYYSFEICKSYLIKIKMIGRKISCFLYTTNDVYGIYFIMHV